MNGSPIEGTSQHAPVVGEAGFFVPLRNLCEELCYDVDPPG